jgi:hypothetical protein
MYKNHNRSTRLEIMDVGPTTAELYCPPVELNFPDCPPAAGIDFSACPPAARDGLE